jgi:RimJ/RimL family protein N-acetyltransferase
MNPLWIMRTGRLVLAPVGGVDLPDLCALKADPRVFAVMLGGVRTPVQSAEELAEDVIGWGANGFGMWSVRQIADNRFVGITGLEPRPDGRGVALRFALEPAAHGRGLAREAASAALRFGHQRACLPRIIAIAREHNVASRTVLAGIGMTECGSFMQQDYRMLVYESIAGGDAIPPGTPAGASH